jgi:hypothetical protein
MEGPLKFQIDIRCSSILDFSSELSKFSTTSIQRYIELLNCICTDSIAIHAGESSISITNIEPSKYIKLHNLENTIKLLYKYTAAEQQPWDSRHGSSSRGSANTGAAATGTAARGATTTQEMQPLEQQHWKQQAIIGDQQPRRLQLWESSSGIHIEEHIALFSPKCSLLNI